MAPEHLLQIATGLAEINTRRPRRADLCRSVSTAYYALFHCLAHTCADGLAGRLRSVGNRPMWRRVYRALEHRQAKMRCENVPPQFPEEMRHFGETFAELQRRRHFADYDPDLPPQEVRRDRGHQRCSSGDRPLSRNAASIRRDFAIHVLMKLRADA